MGWATSRTLVLEVLQHVMQSDLMRDNISWIHTGQLERGLADCDEEVLTARP